MLNKTETDILNRLTELSNGVSHLPYIVRRKINLALRDIEEAVKHGAFIRYEDLNLRDTVKELIKAHYPNARDIQFNTTFKNEQNMTVDYPATGKNAKTPDLDGEGGVEDDDDDDDENNEDF